MKRRILPLSEHERTAEVDSDMSDENNNTYIVDRLDDSRVHQKDS